MKIHRVLCVLFLASVLRLAVGQAQEAVQEGIPNWPAPAFWSSPRGLGGPRASQGEKTPEEVRPLQIEAASASLPFVAITPCRRYDSRNFTPLPQGVNRTVQLTGGTPPPDCGIPVSASAASVNITVFGITGATGNGVFKVDVVSPPQVAWINYPPTETQRGNAGVVALNGGGQIVVQVAQGAGQVDFVVDVNGYYAGGVVTSANGLTGDVTINGAGSVTVGTAGNTITVTGPGSLPPSGSAGGSLAGSYPNPTIAPGAVGNAELAALSVGNTKIQNGSITGPKLGSGFILNMATGDFFQIYGNYSGFLGGGVLYAENDSASGPGAWGVKATSFSTGDGSAGVYGLSAATTGTTYGVVGASSTIGNSAGVRGVTGSSGSVATEPVLSPAGVRGEGKDAYGVFGATQNGIGVGGYLVNSSGFILSGGAIGFSPTVGVSYFNGLAGSGTKSFVEPHPTDASKVIRYVSLEGPEAGTYFRGTDQIRHGMAVIEVPESFRLVTDTEGLTVQLTPIGAPATLYIVSQDLNQIEVRSSRDVKFHYMVNGVRRAYPHWVAIQDNEKFFVPESPSDRLPVYLSEEERGRLIRNGTYNADGTVNMGTADRVGWTKLWAEREVQRQAAAREARKARARQR